MDLVIVESPTKAKTLSKFLGKGYEVTASMGHILDLPKSKLGVDTEHNFEPSYVPSVRSKPVIKTLKGKASKAESVWLSTDPDREGEAIAWHIMQVLASENSKGKNQKSKPKAEKTTADEAIQSTNYQLLTTNFFKRAVFHEITKEAVDEAFKSPRSLDINLVNSQQARRVLDRLVGYKLSPLLWKKVRYGLSAGRVQSVAVRLIVERERERINFKSTEYWSVVAEFSTEKNEIFNAELSEINGKKAALRNKDEVDAILEEIRRSAYKVSSVERFEKRKNPYAPFTTSSLQQAAGNRYGFTASRVMKAAQTLYENGLITYMRTDSTNLAAQALTQIRQFIGTEYGPAYLPESARIYKTKSRLAQEAHEAIRPTNPQLTIDKAQLTNGDEAKIYQLIWQRTVACQMREALFEQTSIAIEGGVGSDSQFKFKTVGSVLKFDGWLRLLENGEESGSDKRLLALSVDEKLRLSNLIPSQHFTEAPARFTEATLIKTLEELGIGRPSTYAPTINTIITRGYVGREGRALYPYEVGMVVNDLLVKHFPDIVDFGFTAEMEGSLDEIAEGKKEWVPVIRSFYTPFEKQLEVKEKEIKKEDVTTLGATSEKCPECGKELVIKLGKFGKFLSCTGFPKCKFAAPMADATSEGGLRESSPSTPGVGKAESVDESQLGKCPEDSGDLVIKKGRFGQFVACINYPKCKFTKPYLVKIGLKCPQCKDGEVILKRSGRGKVFFGCSRYPDCKFASWTKPGTVTETSKSE